MTTTHSTLHSCDSCNMRKNDADCASCKLSSLKTTQSNTKRKGNKDDEEEDYSISERLTEKRRDNSILYLCIASFAILLLVLLFTKLFLQP